MLRTNTKSIIVLGQGFNLGSLDGFDLDESGCDGNESRESAFRSLAAQRYPFDAFERSDGLLDVGAAFVGGLCVEGWLVLFDALVRDHRNMPRERAALRLALLA